MDHIFSWSTVYKAWKWCRKISKTLQLNILLAAHGCSLV